MFQAKKVLAIVLAALMVFAALPMAVFADAAENAAVTYANGSAAVSAKRGDEITVTVNVTAAAATSIAIQMGESYDENAFEFVSGEWLLADGVIADVDTANQNAVITFENAVDVDGAVFQYVLAVKDDAAYAAYSVAAPVVIEQDGATSTVTAAAATVTVAADPADIFTVAEDFEDINVTGTEGAYSAIGCTYPYGKALYFGRGASSANATITFDKAGTADDAAVAFWFDTNGSGYNGAAGMSFVPMTSQGVEMCMGTAYTYYTVIDGVVAEAHPSGNFTIALPADSTGWVIMPLPASGTWHKAGSGTYYGTCEDFAALYLEYIYYTDASMIIDQISFVKDVDAFKTLVAGDVEDVPGYTGTGHVWKNGVCTGCDMDLYTAAQNFESATDDSYVNGVVSSCGSDFGKAVEFSYNADLGSGTASANFQHIAFDNAGTATDEAMVFYYDNTTSGKNAVLYFAPVNAAGAGTTIKTGHPVTTLINGVLTEDNTSIVTSNFTMTLPANSSGWVMLQIGRNGTSAWALWGGAAVTSGVTGISSFAVRTNSTTSVVLDQFGFVKSMDAFAAYASDNANVAGYTGKHTWVAATCATAKTCSVCGATEGEPTGIHSYVGGVCSVCDATVYTVAEDFADASVTGTDGSWSLVSAVSPYGQALKFGREESKTEIKIALDKLGTADDKAIVFYYDNTASGNDGAAYFNFIPYYSGDCGLTLGTGYTYYTVIDGVVAEANPSSNFSLKLPAKTAGWVILPLPASGTWSYGGGDGKIYGGTTENIASIWMAFPEYHNASVLVDQFGFTADVDTFKAEAVKGLDALNGYEEVTVPECEHEYFYPCDAHCMKCGELTNPDAAHNIAHIDAVAATCYEDGNIEYWYCQDCGTCWADEALTMQTNRMSIVVPMAHGTITHVAAVDATCYEDGNIEYWYCEACGQAWLDEACTLNTNLKAVVLPMAHAEATHVAAKDATCYENGNIEYWYCEACGQAWLDEACTLNTNLKAVVVPMGHPEATYVAAKAPTCYEDGNIEYWYCEACGQAWLDAECTLNTNLKAVVLPMAHAEATHVEAVAPTCTENGNIEYWYCEACGQAWLDAECTLNTNLKAVVLPAAHTYVDNCDADCNVCGEYRDAPHTLTTHMEAVVPANCQETGHDEYWICEDCGGYFVYNEWSGGYSETNPAWINYTGEHVRPEGAADCAVVACELCGEDSYGSAPCDRGNAPACQEATCVNCGGIVYGEGHSYGYDEDGNSLIPLCQAGECVYCGEHLDYIYEHENGSYAPCSVDGECVYGCGKQYPATGVHAIDDPCVGGLCWMCWENIAPAHEYSADCDTTCNACGEVREVETAHEYFNACDKVCMVCYEETNPEAAHNIIHVAAVEAADCQTMGNIEYWYCDICGAAWADEALTQMTNMMSVKTGYGDHQYFYPCDKVCMVCYEETNPDAAHNVVHVEAVDPTCQTMGNVEYWYCSDCGAAWLDEAQTQMTNMMSVKLWTIEHDGVGTCTEAGICSMCGEATGFATGHIIADGACTGCGLSAEWVTNEKGNTFFYLDGAVVKGLVKVDGDYYYFSTGDGHMLTDRTIWVAKSNPYGLKAAHYKLGADGKMAAIRNGFITNDKGTFYYVDDVVQKGLYEVDGYYYFSTGDGHMLSNKTIWIGANNAYGLAAGNYYLGADGKMVADGFVTTADGKVFYYVDFVAQKGLQEIDGEYYYFSTGDGHMLTSKTIWIAKGNAYGLAAGNYEIGADGVIIL